MLTERSFVFKLGVYLIGAFAAFIITAEAQICNVSEPIRRPTPQDVVPGPTFLSAVQNFELDDNNFHAEVYVKTLALNARNAPNGKVIGIYLKGHRLIAFAKSGSWVAVKEPENSSNYLLSAHWVHKNFLSLGPMPELSFEQYLTMCSVAEMLDHVIKAQHSDICHAVTLRLRKDEQALDPYFNKMADNAELSDDEIKRIMKHVYPCR